MLSLQIFLSKNGRFLYCHLRICIVPLSPLLPSVSVQNSPLPSSPSRKDTEAPITPPPFLFNESSILPTSPFVIQIPSPILHEQQYIPHDIPIQQQAVPVDFQQPLLSLLLDKGLFRFGCLLFES